MAEIKLVMGTPVDTDFGREIGGLRWFVNALVIMNICEHSHDKRPVGDRGVECSHYGVTSTNRIIRFFDQTNFDHDGL